jgi:hypothetical protein
MQAPILQFPADDGMTITEGRFNKLEERVNNIGERVAAIERAIETNAQSVALTGLLGYRLVPRSPP